MQLTKLYKLKGQINEIKKILVDLTIYGRLHPLIVNVIPQGEETNVGQRYKIIERPYGWLPLRISYYAVVREDENQIEYQIEGLPLTRAKVNYDLKPLSDDMVEVSFELEVNGLPMANRILANKMLDAQNQLMDSIKEELEARHSQDKN